jgi:hypothetical protein
VGLFCPCQKMTESSSGYPTTQISSAHIYGEVQHLNAGSSLCSNDLKFGTLYKEGPPPALEGTVAGSSDVMGNSQSLLGL